VSTFLPIPLHPPPSREKNILPNQRNQRNQRNLWKNLPECGGRFFAMGKIEALAAV
jgi:hypothetical protein